MNPLLIYFGLSCSLLIYMGWASEKPALLKSKYRLAGCHLGRLLK